ncbi:MAG: division/cell wall cluster transcriptional repressor MraZ [Planctomycetota bacterium]|jgi:division/cell wall cluster transcriptional repressor MraZ
MLLGRLSNKLTVDQKGRLAVPAKVREATGTPVAAPGEGSIHRPVELYIGCPMEPCLYLHTEEQHEIYLDTIESVLGQTEEDRRLLSMLNGSFALVTTDKSNRITIPSFLLDMLGIKPKNEVVMIGTRQRVEIWEAKAHEGLGTTHKDDFKKSLEATNKLISDLNRRRRERDVEDHE